ncbi:putative disease resistance protein At3g14460 [Papaver somniferum]|uniref:putative disease resistance protein At3g14460 n=1 Tax=Papaver somniferum TaxID=3469 RepID=UPI000E705C8A|nr:putative disease resistance protein At3g14460 [Papaver somniferum]
MEAVLASGSTIGMEGLGRTTLVPESDWLSIKEYGTEDMKPILWSYDHFPSHLKRCFSYCSIFPKGYVINRETLIQLWMAEGFIPDERGTRSKEDIGNEYFESLLSCKFFVGVERNEVGNINTCTMHDHVHDLAQAVVGDNECISLNLSDLTSVSEIHRLRLTLDEDFFPTSALSDAKKLRTIIILKSGNDLDLQSFRSNDQLRVLYLRGLGAHLSELSNWSSEFKQLRYLNITSFNLSKVTNDISIHELYYLETLVLRGCRNFLNVLRGVGSLENLRNLDLSYTGIDKLPDSVTSLCNLQRLDLNNCTFLTTFPNSITRLNYLKFLDISCTPIEKLPGFISSLHNLQILDVHNCPKLKSLAESVEGLDSLREFVFIDRPQLEVLPEDFGALSQLRYLNVTGRNVKVLPKSCDKLSNLEIVDLSDL